LPALPVVYSSDSGINIPHLIPFSFWIWFIFSFGALSHDVTASGHLANPIFIPSYLIPIINLCTILPSSQPLNFAPVLSPLVHLQVRTYIEETTSMCEPQNIHICDGSETENTFLLRLMVQQGTIQALPKYDNW
jgi:hypothetical protein